MREAAVMQLEAVTQPQKTEERNSSSGSDAITSGDAEISVARREGKRTSV